MRFCTTCGGTLEPGAKFCTKCGAKFAPVESTGSGAAVKTAFASGSPSASELPKTEGPAPVPTTESAPAEVSAATAVTQAPAYEVPAQPSRSSGFVGMLIIGIIVVLGCGAAYLLLAPQKPKGPAPIVDGLQVPVFSGQTYGLERYPGARPITAQSSASEQVIAAFETTDTPEQVLGYYKVRFPVSEFSAEPTRSTLSAEMNGRRVLVSAEPLARGSRVRISYIDGAGTTQ